MPNSVFSLILKNFNFIKAGFAKYPQITGFRLELPKLRIVLCQDY